MQPQNVTTESIFEAAKSFFLDGLEHLTMGRYDLAEKKFRESLRLIPGRTSTLTNLCATLIELDKLDEATDIVELLTKTDPNNRENQLNAGAIAHKNKDLQRALDIYFAATKSSPDLAEGWSGLASVLADLGRYEEASVMFERAITIDRKLPLAWNNYGTVLGVLKQLDKARMCFDQAISLNGSYADAYYNKSLLLLRNKLFKEGFLLYPWRWQTKTFSSLYLETSLPLWDGNVSEQIRLLLWAEQGLGDEIFYASMISELCSSNLRITLAADLRLHPILERSFPGLRLIERNHAEVETRKQRFDAHAPVGMLGELLQLNELKIKNSRRPFFSCDRDVSGSLRRKSTSHKGFRCGIAWRSKNKTFGKEKSIQLIDFRPFFKLPDVDFVNLQYGDVGEEISSVEKTFSKQFIRDIVDNDNDLDGLLSLIDSCDFIITTSNVTAHLAGSIGKRAIVFVPYGKGKIWYWHETDEFSMWYPSLKLFYQNQPHSWEATIKTASHWFEENFLCKHQ